MALLWVLCRPALMCCCVTVWLYSRTLASNYSSIHSFVHLVTNNPDVLPGRLFGVCCFWGWEQREQNGEPKKTGFGSGPEVSSKLSAFCVCAGHRHLLGWLWASAGGYCSYWSYPSPEIGSGAGVHHAEGFQWQCLRSSGGQLTLFDVVASDCCERSWFHQSWSHQSRKREAFHYIRRMFWHRCGDSLE